MTQSNIKATFSCDIKKIWDIVTSLDHYQWRTDINRIEIIEPHKVFIEYTHDNFPTRFTITTFEPYQRYEFDIENDKIKGHWIGVFKESQGIVTIDFTEIITSQKIWMKPFIKSYLKKQQNQYIHDLKKILENEKTV